MKYINCNIDIEISKIKEEKLNTPSKNQDNSINNISVNLQIL